VVGSLVEGSGTYGLDSDTNLCRRRACQYLTMSVSVAPFVVVPLDGLLSQRSASEKEGRDNSK
jgi:hypothetical protein